MLCNHKHCFETILITLSLPTSSCFSRKSHAETWSKGFVCLVFSRLTYVEPKHQSNEHNQAGADDFQGLMRISSVQLLSRVQLFVDPNSWSLLKLMSIESMMPSNHLILCRPLLLPLSIFPSIRVFSSESVFLIRWPKYWSFSFSFSLSNEYSRHLIRILGVYLLSPAWYKHRLFSMSRFDRYQLQLIYPTLEHRARRNLQQEASQTAPDTLGQAQHFVRSLHKALRVLQLYFYLHFQYAENVAYFPSCLQY